MLWLNYKLKIHQHIMSTNRAPIIDQNFIDFVSQLARGEQPPVALPEDRYSPTAEQLLELFESQLISRHLDFIARELRAKERGYYTIGSSGHESNVVLGALARHTDPAFLHYRSGAWVVQRSRQVNGIDIVRDIILSLMAASDDPIARGRHKVWGSRPLWIVPQTSTIASHLPKSVGCAAAIGRGKKLLKEMQVPADSIVLCSFGDASVNHSVAQGAFNAAHWLTYQQLPVPILFVCEDNGIGISVPTPEGFIESTYRDRFRDDYFAADGGNLLESYRVAVQAVERCRTLRRPIFLHFKMVRLMGHAGSDIETEYHTLQEIEATERLDPILGSARLLVGLRLMTARELLLRYEAVRKRVLEAAADLSSTPTLQTSDEVIAALAPFHPGAVSGAAKAGTWPTGVDENRPRHMALLINRGLIEVLENESTALIFGEDVAKKGGVYHVTAGLSQRFGPGRVLNTLLDETSILGFAQGLSIVGFLPIPEIQYLAYVHNAIDQLRGEACSLQFFSNEQFRNPMVIRVAGLAYQKGFGGHFHNDNAIGALREIPGLVIAVPSRGDDAVRMLRSCLALAKVDGRVVVFLEPIALYMTKDLYQEGDLAWSFNYPRRDEIVMPGEGRVYQPNANDLTIVSYGNGLYFSLRAARRLAELHQLHARILDLRWLAPLNTEWVIEHAQATGRLLVVDECRRAGGLGEALIAAVATRPGSEVKTRLEAALDTYVPLGPAMPLVMPSEESIFQAAVALCEAPGSL